MEQVAHSGIEGPRGEAGTFSYSRKPSRRERVATKGGVGAPLGLGRVGGRRANPVAYLRVALLNEGVVELGFQGVGPGGFERVGLVDDHLGVRGVAEVMEVAEQEGVVGDQQAMTPENLLDLGEIGSLRFLEDARGAPAEALGVILVGESSMARTRGGRIDGHKREEARAV